MRVDARKRHRRELLTTHCPAVGSETVTEMDCLCTRWSVRQRRTGTRAGLHGFLRCCNAAIFELGYVTCQALIWYSVASSSSCSCGLGTSYSLANILSNLLDNALKYAGNSGSIEVRASQDLDTATLIVQDQGPGIPLEECQKVLSRFYRLDSRQQGSGLGLSIVVALTYLHGGTVYLEDAAPGLRVRITMPLAKARTLPNGNVSITSRTGTAS